MAHTFHFLCVACALFDDVVVPLFLAIIKDEQKKNGGSIMAVEHLAFSVPFFE